MSFKLHIDECGDYLHITVDGQNSPNTVAKYMAQVVAECRERDCFRVLVHERLEGPRLSPMEVFSLASEGSHEALGVFEAVAYVDESMGDTLEFAETVAVNRGMPLAMFKNLDAARKWISKRESGGGEQDIFLENRDE